MHEGVYIIYLFILFFTVCGITSLSLYIMLSLYLFLCQSAKVTMGKYP